MHSLRWILFGLVLLIAQPHLLGCLPWLPAAATPSLLLPLVFFHALQEPSLLHGTLVSCTLGYLTDLLTIAPVGLYASTYTALFLLLRLTQIPMFARTVWLRALLIVCFSLVQSLLILVLLAIFGQDPEVPRILVRSVLPHALATGGIGLLPLWRLSPKRHKRGLVAHANLRTT